MHNLDNKLIIETQNKPRCKKNRASEKNQEKNQPQKCASLFAVKRARK